MEGKRGIFITFEGGEGAGKSSLLEAVASHLEDRGIPYLKTREPGGFPFGEKVRSWFLEGEAMTPLGELFLVLAARAEHLEDKIFPALRKGKVVLCDRFTDSTIAYQGVARELGFKKVSDLCHFAASGLTPSFTFYLDIDPSLGLARAQQGKRLDRIEEEALSFHQKVREGFLTIAAWERDRVFILDGTQSQKAILKEALNIMHQKTAIPL